MAIRIILADDHILIRECFRSILEKSPDLKVVAEVDNGRDALRLALELLPEVVLMDLGKQELSGIEATRRIVCSCPGVKVLTLSVRRGKRHVLEALKAGASGFLLKDCVCAEMMAAVRTVAGNGHYLSPELQWIAEEQGPSCRRSTTAVAPLTRREREILVMLADGKKNTGIAALLQISPRTVETHRMQVMKKLHIDNLADLTRFAIREELTPLG